VKARTWFAVSILFSLSVGSVAMAEDYPENRIAVLSSPKGCFVFGQISAMRKDQFMLDACTGRLWELVVDTTIPAQYLRPAVYQEKIPVDGAAVLPPSLHQGTK
jgi:hypothetical protein